MILCFPYTSTDKRVIGIAHQLKIKHEGREKLKKSVMSKLKELSVLLSKKSLSRDIFIIAVDLIERQERTILCWNTLDKQYYFESQVYDYSNKWKSTSELKILKKIEKIDDLDLLHLDIMNDLLHDEIIMELSCARYGASESWRIEKRAERDKKEIHELVHFLRKNIIKKEWKKDVFGRI